MYLNCKTNYSFRYGTFFTEELLKAATMLGVTSLALTNINSTCDAWDFVLHCQKEKIKPILGVEIRNGDKFLYILIAANNAGFAWINKFLSDHLLENKSFPEAAGSEPFFNDVWDGFVIYSLKAKDVNTLFINERIGVLPSETTKLFGLYHSFKDKFVIRQPVTFQNKGYYNVHKLLRCIDNNTLLSKLAPETVCSTNEYFLSPSELLSAFQQYPFIVTNTYKLIDACSIEMDFAKDKNKKSL